MLTSVERANNARNISLLSLRQHYLLDMATSLENLEKGTDSSSVRKVLSYSEKIAKIGQVHPQIFDEILRTTT